jgi:uncharacterized protein with NRDE domain
MQDQQNQLVVQDGDPTSPMFGTWVSDRRTGRLAAWLNKDFIEVLKTAEFRSSATPLVTIIAFFTELG